MKSNERLRRIVPLMLILTLITSLFVNLPFSVLAEESGLKGGQSNIVNGSFEDPDNYRLTDLAGTSPSRYKYIYQGEISGWNTTATNGMIEFGWMNHNVSIEQASPHMKPTVVKASYTADGYQLAEVIAAETNSSLYQKLSLTENAKYNWTVHHRGRTGTDTLAFIITDDAGSVYDKSSNGAIDHFNQILNWLKDTKGVTAPEDGKTAAYTVYTTNLKENSSFEGEEGNWFSYQQDGTHPVKFEIHLISTGKDRWGEYTGSYTSDKNKDILFVLTSFETSYSKADGGNLIDKMSFADENGNNLLINPSFDDVDANASYKNFPAANATNPTKGIGWCTTAKAGVVEIGNFAEGRNAYNITVAQEVINEPYIREGEQFAELNADQESSLYQIVVTDPGKMYKWSLSHRGRSGLDTMALIIGPAQFDEQNNSILPKKTNATARDQLMQIVDWLYSQTEMAIDIPKQGCSEKIKIYTPKFNNNGGWVLSDNIFSWQKDAEHTEEWSVWIISSTNDKWHDYGEIDDDATYNYNYIVPNEQSRSIFGFVSHNSTLADGKKNTTYGNLLDNIAFKEYYYAKVEVAMNDTHGQAQIIVNENNEFIHDEIDDESLKSGWALIGSNFTVHVKEAEGEGKRDFIGAYINGTFVPRDVWTINEETGEFTYTFSDIQSATKVNIIFAAQQIYYDSRSNNVYQYDNADGGPEVSMIPEPGQEDLPTYTSHKPYEEDGWKFMGWKYISHTDNSVYLFDAVHRVALERTFVDDTSALTFSIYPSETATGATVSGIPYDEGITFLAEWKYRQRAVAKTFDKDTDQYVTDTKGGTVGINVSYGNSEEAEDYIAGDIAVGKELFASSDETYITVTAYRNTGFTFNGWYDKDGNLVSRNTSYAYKVPDGDTVELFAYFEPYGLDLIINCNVVGDSEVSNKYFKIDCTFMNLRANQLYIISDLVADTEYIIINGERVYNPTTLRADEYGEATAAIYLKHGDSGRFVFLPENCTYTIQADGASSEGFSVRGEVSTAEVLTETTTENLLFYKASQSALLEVGKKYEGITEDGDPIAITKNSSYTFQAATKYTPSIYEGLSASLCFHNPDGTAKNFITKTRILMIDLTDEHNPKYYSYTVNGSASKIALTEFTALGTTDSKFALSSGSTVTEKLVFVVDYVDTEETAESGKISLVYGDTNNELDRIINPTKKTVNIGQDTTGITAEAGNSGKAASVGPFAMDIGIAESSPVINTTYKEDGSSKYAVELSLEGGTLPDGSYAVISGTKYYSSNGYIKIPSLDAGHYSVNVYSPVPISSSSVTFKASLSEDISASPTVPAEITTTVTFICANVAMDADVADKVLNPGAVSNFDVTLKYEGINEVKLTVTKKVGGETLISNMHIPFPTENDKVTVTPESEFIAVSGETYIFSFIGYANGIPVLEEKCCVVGGYVTKNN